MRTRRAWRPVLVLAMVATSVVGVWSRDSQLRAQTTIAHPPLRKIAEFELPGPPGKRFDYLTIDEDDNYLLSAHLAAGLLHVIDLRTNTVVQTVSGVPGVEGVAYIAEGKKVYTSNWGENKIGVIDRGRTAGIKRVPPEPKADASGSPRPV